MILAQPGYRMRARKNPSLPEELTQVYGNGEVVKPVRLWKYPKWTTLDIGTRVEILSRLDCGLARIQWAGHAGEPPLVTGENIQDD